MEVGPPESCMDFSFGFDNVSFSDRVLQLEIIDDADTEPSPDDNLSRWARNMKHRGDDTLNIAIAPLHVRVKTVHVSSLILAVRSPFFRQLFSNGMRESEQRHVTLRIDASEEESFMDLLNYVYSNKLPRTTLLALLDVLVIADKFEVASCLTHCTRLLHNLEMTCESALLLLGLSCILISHTIQPLIDSAKQFLAARFKDVDRLQEEVLNLSLVGIQTVLSSDGLKVNSEKTVYTLLLKWARKHYPNLEERREILRKHLLHLIRFPLMTTAKLKEVLTCTDIDPELSTKIVLDALFFKAETPHGQLCLAGKKDNAASRQFVEPRLYKHQPSKVIEFDSSHQQCATVYIDLKSEEVTHMLSEGDGFFLWTCHLGGQKLILLGRCIWIEETPHFSLSHELTGMKDSAAHTFDYEIAIRMKPSEEFISKPSPRSRYTFGGAPPPGNIDILYRVPWTDLIADGSPYFINGILHLRADFKIKKSQLNMPRESFSMHPCYPEMHRGW